MRRVSILDEDHIFIEDAHLDGETLYCPNLGCEYYGKPFKIERLVGNGSSRGEPQACGQACGSSVTLNYGTAYDGLGSDAVKFEIARRALADGNSRRATARMVEADKDPIGVWLDRAARQRRAVFDNVYWLFP